MTSIANLSQEPPLNGISISIWFAILGYVDCKYSISK